ncbi:MAG: hypothetical protein IH790_01990, partial [Acidobacteria bacterium]|nr:hypothetical protein [Acidobacteriota bacterium]
LRTQDRLFTHSIQLATGQKAQQYTGIAKDVSRLLAVETAQMRAKEYLQNVEVAQRRIELTDLNLDGIESLARELRGFLEDAGDAPATNHASLRTFAINTRALLIEHMNARDGNRYLFSGNRVDQQTVTLDPAIYTPLSLFKADAVTIDSTFYAQYRADVLGTPGFPQGSFYEQIYFDKNGVAPTAPFPADPDNPTATEFIAEDPALWDYYVTRMSSPEMLANPKLDFYQGDGNAPRMRISETTSIAYGITGPFLRSTGEAYDVRKAFPYFVYDRFEFDVPVGEHGDNYSRYLVRMEEMQQAIRIIEQALDTLPTGPTNVDPEGEIIEPDLMSDLGKFGNTSGLLKNEVLIQPTLQGSEKRYHDRIAAPTKEAWLPPKEQVYSNIEALMNHFKIIMLGHGLRPPEGEVYFPVEGANGELGFYIVSDGTDRPWRVRCHPPCFPIMAALGKILEGDQMADIVPTFGSVNMIAGELDR